METARIYSSLNHASAEIRLLEIAPSENEQCGLIGRTTTVALKEETPSYIALSYVWGDASETEEMSLNGSSILITVNLASALRQLRSSIVNMDETTLLWADSVCINQSDTSEKSAQVQMMGMVYQRASRVIVWLGDGDHDTRLAVDALNEIATSIRRKKHLSWMSEYPQLWRADNDENPTGNVVWNSVYKFFCLPYWSRSWTIQEMVFGTRLTFCVGDRRIEWDNLVEFYFFQLELSLGDTPTYPRPPMLPSVDMSVSAGIDEIRTTPLKLVLEARNDPRCPRMKENTLRLTIDLRATEPKDKLFAFYSLGMTSVIPNYSMTTSEVYCQHARSMIEDEQFTDCLRFAGLNAVVHPGFDLPSWVPDWHSLSICDEKLDVSARMYARSFYRYSADQGMPLRGMKINTDYSLLSYGVLLSQVSFVSNDIDSRIPGNGISDTKLLGKVLKSLRGPQPIMSSTNSNSFLLPNQQASMPLLRLLFRTLFMDAEPLVESRLYDNDQQTCVSILGFMPLIGAEDFPTILDPDTILKKYGFNSQKQTCLDFCQQSFFNCKTPRLSDYVSEQQGKLLDNDETKGSIYHFILRNISCCRVFYSSNGCRGLGPNCIRPDDQIYVLSRCPFPVVLRKVEGKFKYVGPCFIVGLMDGEASQLMRDYKIELEKVIIY